MVCDYVVSFGDGVACLVVWLIGFSCFIFIFIFVCALRLLVHSSCELCTWPLLFYSLFHFCFLIKFTFTSKKSYLIKGVKQPLNQSHPPYGK